MRLFALALAIALTGCSHVRLDRRAEGLHAASVPPGVRECQEKNQTAYLTTGGLAVGFGFLAGASGVSTLGFKNNTDGSPSGGQLALGLTSVAVGLGSAVTTFLAGFFASKYNGCSAQ